MLVTELLERIGIMGVSASPPPWLEDLASLRVIGREAALGVLGGEVVNALDD